MLESAFVKEIEPGDLVYEPFTGMFGFVLEVLAAHGSDIMHVSFLWSDRISQSTWHRRCGWISNIRYTGLHLIARVEEDAR